MTLTPVVLSLLLANALLFFAQQHAGTYLLLGFALWPLSTSEVLVTPYGLTQAPSFMPWQLVSYAFLHGNWLHLFSNMFGLWMFGSELEQRWGSQRFALYYFVCVIGAALVQLVVASLAAGNGSIYPTVGASGGVFGILLAFGLLFPERRILLLIPPIPMKAKWFVLGYGLFELGAGVTGSQPAVAHFAHLGGMVFGFLLLRWQRWR